MNIFEIVKVNVKAFDIAKMIGLIPNRSKMVCCPFHDDKHPSMKVDERYYCFGCGAKGDAIDFVANYYEIGLREAAEKIASEFGLSYDNSCFAKEVKGIKPIRKNEYQIWAEKKRDLFAKLSRIHEELHEMKIKYESKCLEDSQWSSLFSLAINELELVDYLYDYCLFEATDEELKSKYEEITKEIDKIEKRINDAKYGTSRSDVGQIRERMAI